VKAAALALVLGLGLAACSTSAPEPSPADTARMTALLVAARQSERLCRDLHGVTPADLNDVAASRDLADAIAFRCGPAWTASGLIPLADLVTP